MGSADKIRIHSQYWAGTWQDCDWTAGSTWKLMFADGRVRRRRRGPGSLLETGNAIETARELSKA
jgi:hypothetical protein